MWQRLVKHLMILETGLIDLFLVLTLTVQSGIMILIFCIHVQILRCTRKYQILDMPARMEDSQYIGQAVTLWRAMTGLLIHDTHSMGGREAMKRSWRKRLAIGICLMMSIAILGGCSGEMEVQVKQEEMDPPPFQSGCR